MGVEDGGGGAAEESHEGGGGEMHELCEGGSSQAHQPREAKSPAGQCPWQGWCKGYREQSFM